MTRIGTSRWQPKVVAVAVLVANGACASTPGERSAAPIAPGADAVAARDGAKALPSWDPEVAVQAEDYRVVRETFRTKLTRHGPSPQTVPMPAPPTGATSVDIPSGSLWFKAWISQPASGDHGKRPAVVFLHGGFGFDTSDWDMTAPYRDAGYVVL